MKVRTLLFLKKKVRTLLSPARWCCFAVTVIAEVCMCVASGTVQPFSSGDGTGSGITRPRPAPGTPTPAASAVVTRAHHAARLARGSMRS